MSKYELLIEELNLTEAEKELLKGSRSAQGAEIKQSRIMLTFYVSKTLHAAADKIIKSNEKLAVASGRYARALNILTAALVFATLVLAVVAAFGR